MDRITLRTVRLLIAFAATAIAGPWQIERVDQGGVGKFSSMKIEKLGNVHVVYVLENEQNPVRYAFWDHSIKRWFQMTVATSGSFCTLVLDSHQRPHISWVDAGTQPGARLHYGFWDGKEWKLQAIKIDAEIIAYYSSIALDPQDRPSISYYEYTGPKDSGLRVRMRVVTWNGQYWQVETVDGDNQSGKFNNLAIDTQGHKHLIYANVNGMTAGIRYGNWDGSSWKVEILEGLPSARTYIGYAACITLDKDGDPHVSYSHYSAPFYVKYAVRKGGSWHIEVVDEIAKAAYPDRNSIVLDERGQPYISYFDEGIGVLKLAHRQSDKWMVETVDRYRAGFTSSVQIHDGTVWISYADETGGGLKVAHRSIDSVPAVPTVPPVPVQIQSKK
jgi:hypothetical protein